MNTEGLTSEALEGSQPQPQVEVVAEQPVVETPPPPPPQPG